MFVRKPRSIEAEQGDLVIIECEVAGDPKPTVTWTRNWQDKVSDGVKKRQIKR